MLSKIEKLTKLIFKCIQKNVLAVKKIIIFPCVHPIWILVACHVLAIEYMDSNVHSIIYVGMGLCIIGCLRSHYKIIMILIAIIAFINGSVQYCNQIDQWHHARNMINTKFAWSAHGIIKEVKVDSSRAQAYFTIEGIWLYSPTLNLSIKTSYKICMYSANNYLPGDHITIKSFKFSSIPKMQFEKFLIKQGILGCAYVSSNMIHLIYRPYFSIARTMALFKNYILHGVQSRLSKETFNVAQPLFWGTSSQSNALSQFDTMCKKWGILHYLARSGLHVAVFIFILSSLLQFLPISKRYNDLLIVALLCVYNSLSWPSISFERALYSACIMKISNWFHKPAHALHTLLLITGFFAVTNPLALTFANFQLSFFITFILLWHSYSHKTQVISSK